MSTTVDPSDPNRYMSRYALIVTPAEYRLRHVLASVDSNVIEPEDRERVVKQLRRGGYE